MTTTPKMPPSLYRGRYYTKEDYCLLRNMVKSEKSFSYQWLYSALNRKPEQIKRRLLSIKNTPNGMLNISGSLYDLMYNTILEDMPPHLSGVFHAIVSWRLQINK